MDEKEPKPLLIIDDDKASSMVLKFRLQSMGNFVVHLADCGQTGLEAVSKERPAVVLCDMNLPDSNGEGLVKQIKDLMPEAAVFVLTADNRAEDEARCRAAGADAYLTKPLDVDRFLQVILPKFLN